MGSVAGDFLPRSGLGFALLVLAGLMGARSFRAAPGEAQAQISRPEPLQDASCVLPESLQRMAGHVLFRYQVSEQGTVHSVETLYASPVPESRKGEFLEALSSCLKGWRYRPARFGAKPIAQQLLVAFHYFRPAPEGEEEVSLPGGRSLPRSHLEEMRREKLRLATSMLEGPSSKEVQGAGWTLRTDVASGDLEPVADVLRATVAAFEAAFPGTPQIAADRPTTLFLFQSDDEFKQVAAFDNLVRMRQAYAGAYTPADRMIFTARGDSPMRISQQVLAHEMTHHLVHERLYGGSERIPFWVNEGIATFIENLTAPKKGRYDLSRFLRGVQHQGGYRWRAEADVYLDKLRQDEAAGLLPRLADFLDGKVDGPRISASVAYGLSWVTVHYLMNGAEGGHRNAFQAWMMAADAPGDVASLSAALGVSVTDLEHAWSRHLRKLRAQR